MPLPQIASLAKDFGVDRSTVERHWAECVSGIKPGEGGKGYGLVVNCVKAKLRSKKLARNK